MRLSFLITVYYPHQVIATPRFGDFQPDFSMILLIRTNKVLFLMNWPAVLVQAFPQMHS
jgi:hypothetical protein